MALVCLGVDVETTGRLWLSLECCIDLHRTLLTQQEPSGHQECETGREAWPWALEARGPNKKVCGVPEKVETCDTRREEGDRVRVPNAS